MFNSNWENNNSSFYIPTMPEDSYKDLLNPLDDILEKFNFEDLPCLKVRKTGDSWIFQLTNEPNLGADFKHYIIPAGENCDADHTTEANSFAHSPQLSSPMGETTAHQDFDFSSKEADSSDKAENIQDLFEDFYSQASDCLGSVDKIISPENSRLKYAISRLLQGVKPTESDLNSFTLVEQCILVAIMDKKKLSQDAKNKKKREEEKQKLFFKGVLKHTEQKFFEDIISSKKKIRRKQLDRSAYYDYYWGDVSRESGLDIANFYHPNRKINAGKTTAQINSAQNPGLKSLNTTYIELILSSARFRAATQSYMDEVFMQEAQKSRPKKITKMLETLQAVGMQAANKSASMSESEQNEFIGQSLKDYILKNAKCKLPWSDIELKDAKDYAYLTLSRQSMYAQMKSFC